MILDGRGGAQTLKPESWQDLPHSGLRDSPEKRRPVQLTPQGPRCMHHQQDQCEGGANRVPRPWQGKTRDPTWPNTKVSPFTPLHGQEHSTTRRNTDNPCNTDSPQRMNTFKGGAG